MIKKHFKKLSFIVIALMTIAVYTTTVAAKPEFKPYVADGGAFVGGLLFYELYKNDDHYFMRIWISTERGITTFRLFNLNTGEVFDYSPKKAEEFIDTYGLTQIPHMNNNSSSNPKVHNLGSYEFISHQLGSCSPIPFSYSFKDKGNNNSLKQSLVVTGDLVFSDMCETVSEWGPIPVVSRSLKVRDVWTLPDELYVVAFRNHPAILYIDNSKSFDNPFNEGANFTIVDHQVIENILNDEKLEQNSYKKRLSLPKPLTDKTKKELLTLLKPAYTAKALKEHLDKIKQNNKDK